MQQIFNGRRVNGTPTYVKPSNANPLQARQEDCVLRFEGIVLAECGTTKERTCNLHYAFNARTSEEKQISNFTLRVNRAPMQRSLLPQERCGSSSFAECVLSPQFSVRMCKRAIESVSARSQRPMLAKLRLVLAPRSVVMRVVPLPGLRFQPVFLERVLGEFRLSTRRRASDRDVEATGPVRRLRGGRASRRRRGRVVTLA